MFVIDFPASLSAVKLILERLQGLNMKRYKAKEEWKKTGERTIFINFLEGNIPEKRKRDKRKVDMRDIVDIQTWLKVASELLCAQTKKLDCTT